MSKLSWKTLGLAALVAGGLQMATMGGAAALTLPVPATPGVDAASQVVPVKYYKKYGHRRWRYTPRYGHRYRYRRHGYGYYYGGWWYARPYWRAPVVPVPVPAPGYGSRHVRWCLNHYRSYNPRTDRYLGYDGYYHRCRSPY